MNSLESDCLELSSNLRHVRVHTDRIERVAADLGPTATPTWDHPAFPDESGPWLDAVVWLGNAINYCYWTDGEPMWSVLVGRRREVDALAVFGAVHLALLDGVDLCDARTLDAYAPTLIDSGDGRLPLAEQRIAHLREIATLVALQFSGRLENAIAAAPRCAPDHARYLADTFPGFRDVRTTGGKTLPFLKRAQLAAAMLHAARTARGAEGLRDTEHLSLFSDYMLPRTLRALGILEYSPMLAAVVDNSRRLAAGGELETDLRVATIAAGALLRRASGRSTLELDYWLWQRGFEVDASHHRTLTTDY